MPTPMIRVSIIVPCRNEERFIAACLDSILATSYPLAGLEILVVDGASDDGTRAIVETYAARHACIRMLDNPRRHAAAALNVGIRAAGGGVIVRMDAHATYPSSYIPRLVAALHRTGADNVGARQITRPGSDHPVARAIAVATSHPFGVGNTWFRIGTSRPRWVDTVPFGCYRRDVFDRIGMFDEDMVRNQDDEFNHRLLRHGGRVLLLPDVEFSYFARTRFGHLARMFYQYGSFKPLVARKVGRVVTARQLAPAALLVTLVAGGTAALLSPLAARAWFALVLAYGLAILLSALTARRPLGPRARLALAAAFPIMHLSYGAGFVHGLAGLTFRPLRPRDPAAIPLSR